MRFDRQVTNGHRQLVLGAISSAIVVAVALGPNRVPVAAQGAPHALVAQNPTPTATPKPCATPIVAINVSVGLGFRVAKVDCSITVSYPTAPPTPTPTPTPIPGLPTPTANPKPTASPVPPESVTVVVFADPGNMVKATYSLLIDEAAVGAARNDSLSIELVSDEQAGPAFDPVDFQKAKPLVTYRVHPTGTCEATTGTCTVTQAKLGSDPSQTKKIRWSGTMMADIGQTSLVARNDGPSDRVRYLLINVKRGTSMPLGLDRNVIAPARIKVAYDPQSDIYSIKPNADTKKIRDGVNAFLRSRLGFDGTQNWSSSFRASAGVGQSATDQTAGAKRAGDDLLQGSNDASGATDGFAVTDADAFAFPDLGKSASRLAFAPSPLKKDLGDSAAAVSPFALSNIVAPDGAFKLVTRNDGGPGRPWRVVGGLLFATATGDDPNAVADGAAVVTALRSSGGSTTSISALYAVANRIQISTDFVNGPFVTIPSKGGVTRSVAVPSPRPIHVVNEGIQIADDRPTGFSTFLRATVEPSRMGSDLFAAERWSGETTFNPQADALRSVTLRYGVLAGWRATGNEFIAPLGSRVDLSGTRGPFYLISLDRLSFAPDFRRQVSLAFYQSRWSDSHGLQQYTSRLDALVDFENRLGVTGTGTMSAATLELLTRESTHIPLPLKRTFLVPLRQGSLGLSWRPPNGEFTLSRGYAFLTDCENVASTPFAPPGLLKNTMIPACTPIGRATFSGNAHVTSGRLTAALSYGGPTAVERTPILGGAIQRAAALRYKFGCDVLQAAYTNRGGYDGLTDVAGSTYGVTLELHNLIRTHGNLLGERRVLLTLSYAGSTKIPLGGPAQSKTAFNPAPDVLHTADANGC